MIRMVGSISSTLEIRIWLIRTVTVLAFSRDDDLSVWGGQELVLPFYVLYIILSVIPGNYKVIFRDDDLFNSSSQFTSWNFQCPIGKVPRSPENSRPWCPNKTDPLSWLQYFSLLPRLIVDTSELPHVTFFQSSVEIMPASNTVSRCSYWRERDL